MRDDVDAMVGRRLRMRRRLLDLSQQDLANVCGVTFQQIQKYEAAKCRIPVATLWRLAYALEVEVSYFFDGLQPAPKAPPGQPSSPDENGIGPAG